MNTIHVVDSIQNVVARFSTPMEAFQFVRENAGAYGSPLIVFNTLTEAVLQPPTVLFG